MKPLFPEGFKKQNSSQERACVFSLHADDVCCYSECLRDSDQIGLITGPWTDEPCPRTVSVQCSGRDRPQIRPCFRFDCPGVQRPPPHSRCFSRDPLSSACTSPTSWSLNADSRGLLSPRPRTGRGEEAKHDSQGAQRDIRDLGVTGFWKHCFILLRWF